MKMMRSFKWFTVLSVVLGAWVVTPVLAEEAPEPPQQDWSFQGPFSTFDRAELQRGFQVYKEVCQTCHGMKLLSYRNLSALGYTEAQIKAIAAEYTVKDGPDGEGEMFERPALPSDRFVNPYPNDQAARAANNSAMPPDLSLMSIARKHGPDYTYAILTGYVETPAGVEVGDGLYYNEAFAGYQIAMPAPLAPDLVTYSDGTHATVEQMARDVTVFLSWAAEPQMEVRKRLGITVLIFLLAFSALMYAYMKRVWERVH